MSSMLINHCPICSFAGSLLSVPLHPRDHGQGEGREAEAVFAAWSSGQGAQVTRAARKRTPSEEPRLFCCVLYYALEHIIKWRDAMRNLTYSLHFLCLRSVYRVAHRVSDLGWVEFDFGCSTVCQILLGLMRYGQAEWNMQIKVNPTQVRDVLGHPVQKEGTISELQSVNRATPILMANELGVNVIIFQIWRPF